MWASIKTASTILWFFASSTSFSLFTLFYPSCVDAERLQDSSLMDQQAWSADRELYASAFFWLQ